MPASESDNDDDDELYTPQETPRDMSDLESEESTADSQKEKGLKISKIYNKVDLNTQATYIYCASSIYMKLIL